MSDEELKALVDTFRQKLALDPEIRAAEKKIAEGKADFSDTSRMFWRRSELLGDYMQGIVPDLAPEDRERLAEALLRMGYNDTNAVLVPVQEALDVPLGVHLTPVVPKYPAERVATVAHALMDPTVPEEKIARRAGAPVANVNMSYHDKFMEENARIRARLGMKPTITRYGSGCCKWCSEVAGRYSFGEQPKDIFRRHDNCDCVIIYDTQVLRGAKTEDGGRSKTWQEVDPSDLQTDPPKVFSQEEAEQIQSDLMLQFRELQYDAAHPIRDTRNFDFGLQRVTTAQNPIFVSDGARKAAKPKQIHAVDTHFTEVTKMMGIQHHDNLPDVHVLDGMEMGSSAVASYSPIKNTLNINLAVATYDKTHIPAGMECFAGYKDDRSSYLHELLHWQDAEKYRKRYGDITEQNYSEYIDFINRDAKKKLDKLMKKGYNIGEISDYALEQYRKGKFYETYTEFRVVDLLRRK